MNYSNDEGFYCQSPSCTCHRLVTCADLNDAPTEQRKIENICCGDSFVWALCNDGSVYGIGVSNKWTKLPPIPQDDMEVEDVGDE